MKLTDLIEAFAGEIEGVQPQLEGNLRLLSTLGLADVAFMDALDQYSSQVQRMGEAAEMAGFPGLQAICGHVLNNILLLATYESPGERKPLIDFLRRWPDLMVHYLRNINDPSSAAGLVDHLRIAPSPIDTEEAFKVMHMLGSMMGQINMPGGGGGDAGVALLGEHATAGERRQRDATQQDAAAQHASEATPVAGGGGLG